MEIEIGTWWPELGDFQAWLDKNLEIAKKQFIIYEHRICDNYRGGAIVLAKGQRR